MSTAKSLQVPTIIEVIGSTIRIKHPDISGNIRTEATSPLTAGGTTLTVADNDGFEDNDWFLLGEIGDEKTEEDDVNGAVTRGTSLTITNTTKFSHEIHTPITKINERKFKIYGASTSGGTGTIIASVSASGQDIQWNKPYSEWVLISTDTAYTYYYATFYDGTTESSASDYVLATGLPADSGYEMAKAGLREVNATVDSDLITWEWLLDVVNDWQEEVLNYMTQDGVSKDWSFEVGEDSTSLTAVTNQHKYALSSLSDTLKYPLTQQGIIEVKFGADILEYVDREEMESNYDGMVMTQVKTAATAGDTSVVLDDTYEFADSGTAYLGSDTITYTGNTESSGTLTGIPASGTGAITTTQAIDTYVWQGISPSTPETYNVYNGYIILDKPVVSTKAGYKIKVKYLKKLSRLGSLADSTDITFAHLAKYFIGSRIESRKGNLDNAQRLLAYHMLRLEEAARKDRINLTESFEYYKFD